MQITFEVNYHYHYSKENFVREISNSIFKEHILTFGVNFALLALLELVWQVIHVIFPAEKSAKYSTQCGCLNS